MVGGGQLARMTHQAAIALGQSLRVLAISPDEPRRAGQPRTSRSATTPTSTRCATFGRASTCSPSTTSTCRASTCGRWSPRAFGIHPAPDALGTRRTSCAMREQARRPRRAGPPFAEVTSVDDAVKFGGEHGWPVVLKAISGGYDGRGVWMLDDPAAARDTVPELLDAGTPLMVEQKVRDAPGARRAGRRARRSARARAWPVVETVQADGICVEVLAPAPGLDPGVADAVQDLALRIADADRPDRRARGRAVRDRRRVLINELAMRPHNSGHWTIEGARTSQFEQHLRAVLDYPLGADRPGRAGRGDGERAGRARDAHDGTRRAAAPPVRAVPRRARAPTTASRSDRAARSGHVTCSATTSNRRAARLPLPRTGFPTASGPTGMTSMEV